MDVRDGVFVVVYFDVLLKFAVFVPVLNLNQVLFYTSEARHTTKARRA